MPSPKPNADAPNLQREAILPFDAHSQEASWRSAELLIGAMRDLSRARTRFAVAEIVKTVARKLVGADGATFVLRDGRQCFYLDEDAISPLWKGQRFPMEACVSGWVMDHAEQVVMPDIYEDPRVPHAAYRPTFVKSLVMTPVRRVDPVAAIGIYWAEHRQATAHECELVQNLADTTAVALENATLYEELELRVAERTEQLEQANAELESFSHTVAHDLRSPLNAIIGFAELLVDRGSELPVESVRTYSAEIAGAGLRMDDLIGVLLEFARGATVDVQRTDVDLSARARTMAETLLVEGRHERTEVVIAPGLRVYADAPLVDVVLTNLIGNAMKYSSKVEAPRVEFGALHDADGSTTYFVRDNGAGFDPTKSDRLFLPFQRLHSADDFRGNGVGLATVARIVRRHGGSIRAEGKPGEGAIFYFTLPDGP